VGVVAHAGVGAVELLVGEYVPLLLLVLVLLMMAMATLHVSAAAAAAVAADHALACVHALGVAVLGAAPAARVQATCQPTHATGSPAPVPSPAPPPSILAAWCALLHAQPAR
jgi:hypothetical protein